MSFSLSGYSRHLALNTNVPYMAIYQASRVDPAIIIDDPETMHILFNATPEHRCRTCRNRSIDARVIYYTYLSGSNMIIS